MTHIFFVGALQARSHTHTHTHTPIVEAHANSSNRQRGVVAGHRKFAGRFVTRVLCVWCLRHGGLLMSLSDAQSAR